MAAFLGIVLFGVAAITVDLGIAYVSKRQLQTAADAGVLAAVQVYKGQSDACTTLQNNLVLKQQAQAAADKWAAWNRPGMVGDPVTVACIGDTLTVRYGAKGATGTSFTGMFNGPSTITTKRFATAIIGAASVGGLRPWGVCSQVVSTSGNVVFVPMLDGSTTSSSGTQVCGNQGPPGGWWIAQCVGQSNANGTTEDIVLNGCPQSNYLAVPNQQASWNANQLYNHLTTYCPSRAANTTCLSSDPGNNFHNATEEWQTLVGQTIQMPVFCVRTKCSNLAVSGSGNNSSYAIQQIAIVEVCGFKMNPRGPSTGWPTTGPCATRNPSNYTSTSVTSGAGFFLVVKGLVGGSSPSWRLPEYKEAKLSE